MHQGGRYAVTVKQGDSFRLPLTWSSGNPPQAMALTGYSFFMDVSARPGQPMVMELTTANGRIAIVNADAGEFELLLSKAETAALSAGGSDCNGRRDRPEVDRLCHRGRGGGAGRQRSGRPADRRLGTLRR